MQSEFCNSLNKIRVKKLNIFKKIPVRIDPIFWLVAIFIAFLNSNADLGSVNDKIIGTVLWVGIIVFSLLVHEYGHALTAFAFGQSAKIDLIGIGGVTQRQGKKLKLWQEFIIVLNGPLFSVTLAFAAFLLLSQAGKISSQTFYIYALRVIINVNIFWTIINLLPVQPLDGGRLLSIILESIFGLKGVKAALFLSIILASLIGILFFLVQFVLAGALFFLLAFESYRSWKSSLPLTEEDQSLPIQQMLQDAESDMRGGKGDDALLLLEKVRQASRAGVIYLTATQDMAHILYEKGRFKEAFELLYPLKNQINYDSLRLLHQLAFQSGQWKAAVELGNLSYQILPSYDTALLNALSYSLQGDVQPAVGWLECAIRDGMPNVRAILSKSEFDTIRHSQKFQDLLNKSN